MSKKWMIFMVLLCFISVNGGKQETVGSRMYKGKWKPVVRNIVNLDSLICTYIESNEALEMCKKTFDVLSDSQKSILTTCKNYSGTHISFLAPDSKETVEEHSPRLSFVIYNKYFDRK